MKAGNVPLPTLDNQGNPQTYYAIYFPPGITITTGSEHSCSNFCAYHGTIAATDSINEYYFGVHPDMTTGSCTGCAWGTTFEKYCIISSHELVEMITGMT